MIDEQIHDSLLSMISDGLPEGVMLNEHNFDSNSSVYEIIIDNEIIFVSENSIKYKNEEYFPEINVLYSYLEMEIHGDDIVQDENSLENILSSFK